jgi:hypothetical protein
MTTTTSRRAVLAGAAALPALAASAPAASTTDPIFAAIELHRERSAEYFRLCEALDISERQVRGRLGRRPVSLVPWRKYSHIGRWEIDKARKEFLRDQVASPKRIEAEYRRAVRRYHDTVRAEAQWYRDAGLRDQRRSVSQAGHADKWALKALQQAKPTTVAGASAFVSYIADDMEIGEHEWQQSALRTLAASLRSMAVQS